jgi:hypothetical protein
MDTEKFALLKYRLTTSAMLGSSSTIRIDVSGITVTQDDHTVKCLRRSKQFITE